MLKEKIHRRIETGFQEMTGIRRHLHMHPELSHQESETPEFIAAYLEKLGIEVRRGVGGRGVVGTIRGGKPGKTIAFRADFDALPIQDAKDVPYKSTVPGVMHACGHDGHTAALLVFAEAMNEMKDELSGNVILIHQFGEEAPPGGSRAMIADGCLDGVDEVYGAHVQSQLEAGFIYGRDGYLQAAEDTFTITVNGSGTHGAEPHLGADPILAASHIMVALQAIVSRHADPLKSLVVSVGKFHAGEADNVIPERAVMEGTIRVFDPELRKLARRRLKATAASVAEGLGCTADVAVEQGYDSLYNHPEQMETVRQAAGSRYTDIEPIMPVEDFAYYTQHRPGAFFFVGAKPPGTETSWPHHHEKFDFHEPAMVLAAQTFAAVFLEAQERKA
ncbi:M20 metallopeptidase family protein [Indiicoccus explosivorum]|uniref:M20 metallopeptidase family protein n=1 Tax=Indiicoccus explosivorum TaxID=1917864 RepID=UPI000B436651|nr:amidohydrolase [Indiicoccus explosivorum]